MEVLDSIAAFVSGVGLPAALIAWGAWFVTVRAWPDHVRIQELQTTALIKLSEAVQAVADRAKD